MSASEHNCSQKKRKAPKVRYHEGQFCLFEVVCSHVQPPKATKVVQDIERSPHKKQQPSKPTSLKAWAISLKGLKFQLKGSFWDNCDDEDKEKQYECEITKSTPSVSPIEFEFKYTDGNAEWAGGSISYANVLAHIVDEEERGNYYLFPSIEAAKEAFKK